MSDVARRRASPVAATAPTIALVLALVWAIVAAVVAPPVDAAPIETIGDAEAAMVAGINRERQALGRVAYQVDPALMRIAGARSADMVRHRYFSHTEPDGEDYLDYLKDEGVPWYSAGETIAWDRGYPLSQTADVALDGWMHSSGHRAILTSGTYNYFGVGLAIASDGTHKWTAVFTRSPDHTAPWVVPRTRTLAAASGGTRAMTLPWTAQDRPLQAVTSGLRDVEVQRTIDGGAWTSLGWFSGTEVKRNLTVGKVYRFRLRARDNAGNVGAWTSIVVVRP